jgi:tetratricopeptide (TPR) repeat protein
MALSYHSEDDHSHDPLYREGAAHLQAGEWQDAIRIFDELARRYPEDRRARNALEMAQFKADLDAGSRVKPKQVILPSVRVLVPALVVLVVVGLIWGAFTFMGQVLTPLIAQSSSEIEWNRAIAAANDLLRQEEFDAAMERIDGVLAQSPDHAQARGLKATIQVEHDLYIFYMEGVSHQEAGDYGIATVIFQDIERRRTAYKDVERRIAQMAAGVDLQQIFLRAELLGRGTREQQSEAVALYEQVRRADGNYQRATVENRLIEFYLAWGREIVDLDPAAPERMPEALAHFDKALSIRRSHSQSMAERQLAITYLNGEAAVAGERWQQAASDLLWVYNERPDYLQGHMQTLLYTALVELADLRMEQGRKQEATFLYNQAKALEVDDLGRAERGLAQAAPTPTPVPTSPPAPVRQVAPAAPPPPAATPAPTPMPSMAEQYGRIIFKSANPGQPGIWSMDANGENRVFLGNSNEVQRQFEALYNKQLWSNGRLLFVRDTETSAQVFVNQPNTPDDRQLTLFSRVSYQPVWSPDGQSVAFVSQEGDSDDIWAIAADGSNPRRLTHNTWEWDKHPSWSPDSDRIVFWSNRTGIEQIYVMNADGSNQQNISNVIWKEHDPIWVK